MIKIKDKKRFVVFILILVCFLLSGAYLIIKIVNFKKNIGKVPEASVSFQEGINKLSTGDFDSASEFLEKAVAEDDNPEKIKMLAVSQYNQKNYDEAIKNFEKLLDVDGKNGFVYYNSLANIYRDQDKFKEAIDYYQKAIDSNPKYETAYQNLIILYLYEIDPREPEKVQEIVKKGLENLPDSEVLKKMKQ